MSIASSTTNRNQKKYRIVFLGDQGVGKTSIIQKYTTGRYQQTHNSTVGIDFNVKDVAYNGQQFRLQMWDTAGQQRYRSLIPTYLKNAHFAILVFDITKPKSLENLEVWYKLFREHQQSPVIFVGNKCDLVNSKKVNKADIDNLTSKYKVDYIEVSAKTGKKIDELFQSVIENISKTSISKQVITQLSKQESQQVQKEGTIVGPKQSPRIHKKLKKAETVVIDKKNNKSSSNCCSN